MKTASIALLTVLFSGPTLLALDTVDVATRGVPSGTTITSSVPAVIEDAPGARSVCRGWTGTGSVPPSGTGHRVVWTASADATLTWLWGTEYHLDTAAGPRGSVAPPDGWFPAGQSVTLTARPDSGYEFDQWVGYVPPGFERVNPLSVRMDQPLAIMALFKEGDPQGGEEGRWVYGTSMPRRRYAGVAALVDGKIYILGGESPTSYDFYAEVDRYDPATDTWEPDVTRIPHRRQVTAGAVVGGKIYCIGGFTGGVQSYVDIYDTDTGSWSSGASMPAARRVMRAWAVGTDIYVFGGAGRGGSGTPIYDSVYRYDTTADRWESLNPMQVGRFAYGVHGRNGFVYLFGGYEGTSDQDYVHVDDVDQYNPAGDSWSSVTPLPAARSDLGVGESCGAWFAFGGYNADWIRTTTVWRHNRQTSEWREAAPLNTGRTYFMHASDGHRIYIFGGNTDAGITDTMEIYHPEQLLAHWRFDEGSGTMAHDSSGNGCDGTVHGAAWTEQAAPVDGGSHALSFDGVDDYVEVPDDGSLSGFSNVTVSCWFKADSFLPRPGEPSYLVSKDYQGDGNNGSDCFALNVYGLGGGLVQVHVEVWSGSGWGGDTMAHVTVHKPLETGCWYHLAFTYDMSMLRLFLDGREIGATPYSKVLNANTSVPLRIGECSGPRDRLFKGVIDEVKIYNRAVTSPPEQDSDGDFWSDVDELEAGSSPDNPNWFPLPAARFEMGCAAWHGRIYLAGGADGPGAYDTLWEFKPSNNQYTVRAPMPAPRRWLRLVALGPYLYAIGGSPDPSASSAVFRYDPRADVWTSVASMHTARSNFGAAALNGRIYVFGGDNNGGARDGAEVYDPRTNTWTLIASLPYRTYSIDAVAGSDNRIYIFGGGSWPNMLNDDVIIYDPATDSYRFGASLSSDRTYLAAVRMGNDTILAIGGGDPRTDAIESYSPSTDTWDRALPYRLILPRYTVGAAVLGGQLYVFGGESPGPATVEKIPIEMFRIGARAGRHGTMSPCGAVSAVKGSSKSFSMAADPGWQVSDVTIDGASVGPTNAWTFGNMARCHKIHVTFAPDGAPLDPLVDSDGDGSPDDDERTAGTDPGSRSERFCVREFRRGADGEVICWDTVPGRIYTLYSATDLASEWLPVVEVPGDGTRKSYTNTHLLARQRFFRLGVRLAE